MSFLRSCGKKTIELKTLGCCRSCYDRRHHSLRFFGGLRERVMERAFAAVVVASVRRWWSIVATGATGRICWSPCASAAIYASITRRD